MPVGDIDRAPGPETGSWSLLQASEQAGEDGDGDKRQPQRRDEKTRSDNRALAAAIVEGNMKHERVWSRVATWLATHPAGCHLASESIRTNKRESLVGVMIEWNEARGQWLWITGQQGDKGAG